MNAPVKVSRQLTVLNELGLHARPAAEFVKQARTFRSEIHLVTSTGRFRADRVLEVLMADLWAGATFTLEAIGPDAQEAVDRLEALMHELR